MKYTATLTPAARRAAMDALSVEVCKARDNLVYALNHGADADIEFATTQYNSIKDASRSIQFAEFEGEEENNW